MRYLQALRVNDKSARDLGYSPYIGHPVRLPLLVVATTPSQALYVGTRSFRLHLSITIVALGMQVS
jgi:hypothetical protein